MKLGQHPSSREAVSPSPSYAGRSAVPRHPVRFVQSAALVRSICSVVHSSSLPTSSTFDSSASATQSQRRFVQGNVDSSSLQLRVSDFSASSLFHSCECALAS
ncbi:hypothetical protein LINPERHAP2_LOCUS3724 [Linum perenne]